MLLVPDKNDHFIQIRLTEEAVELYSAEQLHELARYELEQVLKKAFPPDSDGSGWDAAASHRNARIDEAVRADQLRTAFREHIEEMWRRGTAPIPEQLGPDRIFRLGETRGYRGAATHAEKKAGVGWVGEALDLPDDEQEEPCPVHGPGPQQSLHRCTCGVRSDG